MANRRDTTPGLRRFYEQGARFNLAYAPMAITATTHATIFTGLYPITHGVIDNGIPIPEQYLTLAEMFCEHGY